MGTSTEAKNKTNESGSGGSYIFTYFITAIATLGFLVSLVKTTFLPLSGFFLAVIIVYFFFIKPKFNVVNLLIIFISCIRYVVIPLSFYFANNYIYSSYIRTYFANCGLSQLLMIGEMFAIFAGLSLWSTISKRRPKNEVNPPKRYNGHFLPFYIKNHFASFMVILVSLFFVFVYPALVPFVNGNKPSNSVQSVFQVGVVCLFCLLFSWIRNSSLSENKQLLFQILCFLVLSILMSVSYNSISRNVFLINAFIFSVLMFEFYPQRKKQLIYIFVFGAIFVLGFLTYYKMLSKSFSISFLFDSLLLYSRYSILNAYFAGPTNVDLGLSMIQSWNIGGFKWLISDFFGNISILNHFSSEQNTVYLFNDFIYHGVANQDIIPSCVQAVVYFGPMFFWIYPLAMSFFPNFLFGKFLKKNLDISILYALLFIVCVFSMSQIISFNAVSMLIFLRPIPLLFLVLADKFLSKIFFDKNITSKTTIQINAKRSVKSNYIFSLFHQMVMFVAPVIVTPYLSRVLLSTGIGQYNFAYSIVQYFVIIGCLGFSYYAQRQIAATQNDRHRQSVLFYEISIARLIPVLLSFSILVLCLIFDVFTTYTSLIWILSINVISAAFDFSFYFQGNENFQIVTVVQSLLKIVSTVLIFVFVKSKDDVWIYAFLMSAYSILSCVLLIPFLHKSLCKIDFKVLKIWKHFAPAMLLFVPSIAGFFYTSFLPVMINLYVPGQTVDSLGNVVKFSDIQNGYFSQADKIVQMCISVMTSLGAVMASRNTSDLANGDTGKFVNNIVRVASFDLFLSLPMAFGLAVVADSFVPWFFGSEFDYVVPLLKVYSPIIILIVLNNVFGFQVFVPLGKFRLFALTTIVGAVVSAAIGYPLIHFYGSVGAGITALISQTSVLVSSIVILRNVIPFKMVLKSSLNYFLASILMFSFIFVVSIGLNTDGVTTATLCFIGIVVYSAILYLLKDSLFMDFASRIKNTFSSKLS